MKPTPGFCCPVEFLTARDGDTVVVRISGSAFVWAIRLIDVWAPELHSGEQRQQAAAAKAFLSEYLQAAEEVLLYVPLPSGENLLKSLTFDRIPGVLFAGEVNVNELLVKKGYASTAKHGKLGQ